MPEIPLKSDRAARDSRQFPAFHATDLEAGVSVQHLPQNAEVGEAPVWDGTKYVASYVATQQQIEELDIVNGVSWTIVYNEVSPQTILEVPAGHTIISGLIHIKEVWESDASIKVGTAADDDLLFDASDLELDGLYVFDKSLSNDGPLSIIVTFSPGTNPTGGQATIVLETTIKETL